MVIGSRINLKYCSKQQLAWAWYDWANSAYATCIMTVFFPILFAEYWSDLSDVKRTFYLGSANSMASLLIVISGPLLGAIADYRNSKKAFLFFFMMLGVFTTALLWLVGQGQWLAAISLYVFSSFSFMAANIFYDALLVDVSAPKERDKVSALGYGLGYLGGGLALGLAVVLSLWPQTFGFADAAQAIRWVFIIVALWWVLFTMPILMYVNENRSANSKKNNTLVESMRKLLDTFKKIRRLRVTLLFLIAYWCYIDGVDTIIRMATNYGRSIHLEQQDLVIALLMTQFVGFPAAIAFGKLGEVWGAKTGIFIALWVYILVTIWAYFMQTEKEFYMMAIVIGLVQGGIQSLSRSLFTRIIPAQNSAEFFGFYNMLGKFAAVLGPFMVGWVSAVSGNPRLGILVLVVFFIIGGGLLYFVDEQKGVDLAGKAI